MIVFVGSLCEPVKYELLELEPELPPSDDSGGGNERCWPDVKCRTNRAPAGL